MKRLILAALVLLSARALFAQTDSTRLATLDAYIEQYAGAMTFESIAAKEKECDYMIGSVGDSLLRNHVGDKLYRYYLDSPVMGEEEVAIYLWDKWFEPSKLVFENLPDKTSRERYFEAKLFADFNRRTLIGEKAPVLRAKTPCGLKRNIPATGTPAILYFYDTSCGKCKVESKVLPTVLKNCAKKVNFYAFYSGSDPAAWKAFRKSFSIDNPNIRLIHVWDPKVSTDYLRLYGVLATPKLYVTTAGGQILGRRLEVENLLQVLELL